MQRGSPFPTKRMRMMHTMDILFWENFPSPWPPTPTGSEMRVDKDVFAIFVVARERQQEVVIARTVIAIRSSGCTTPTRASAPFWVFA